MTNSTDSLKTLTAKCHCQAIQYTVSIPAASLPLPVHLCHCGICRHTHGTTCVVHTPLPADIKPEFISPSNKSKLTAYARTGSDLTRYFCSTCGCHIGDEHNERHTWVISTSLFDANRDEPGIWEIKKHIYTDSALDGGLSEWLPRVGDREMQVVNPPGQETEEVTTDLSDTLLAECDCGGVSFRLSRPTPEILADSNLRSKWVSPVDEKKWIASLDVCDSCRLTAGVHVMAWMFVPKTVVSPALPEDLLIGSSKAYASSDGVQRTFCGTCGAKVFYGCEDRKDILDVAVGLLRAPEGVKAEGWLTWRTARIGSRGDGMRYDAALTDALCQGMEDWDDKNSTVLDDIFLPTSTFKWSSFGGGKLTYEEAEKGPVFKGSLFPWSFHMYTTGNIEFSEGRSAAVVKVKAFNPSGLRNVDGKGVMYQTHGAYVDKLEKTATG